MAFEKLFLQNHLIFIFSKNNVCNNTWQFKGRAIILILSGLIFNLKQDLQVSGIIITQDDPVYIKPTRDRTTKLTDMTKIEHLFTINSLKYNDVNISNT